MSLIKTIFISQIAFLLPSIGECTISTDQQDADGSAAAYTDSATGQIYVPSVEIKNGKRYYTWPNWNKSKNRKMQVHRERTAHPGAQWWPHAGLGLFMHWGIVSEFEPSGEAWSGRWHQKRADRFHPQSEIWEAAKTFNPRNYDPDKWMAGARRAGFRYSVLTTKHHDGYALWDSDTALIGVRQYMNGRCLVTPFVEACRKNDVKVGFYYSGMDWYFDRGHMNFALGGEKKMNYKGEIVDALPAPRADRPTAIKEFNQRQVEELINRFKPDIWWGDGGHGASIEYIRELHPPIVINNRDGESGDHATPEGFQMAHPRFIRKPVLENGWWWELCTRHFYHAANRCWRCNDHSHRIPISHRHGSAQRAAHALRALRQLARQAGRHRRIIRQSPCSRSRLQKTITMKKLLLILIAIACSGCSSTRIEQAYFQDTTINSATWKSQAGVGQDAVIEATTAPKTDASLTGL